MILNKLHDQINKKKSFLCIGLDIDKNKIPKSILELDDPIFEFAKELLTLQMNMQLLINQILHFLRLMVNGFKSLNKIVNYLNQSYPEILTIADAKRGDIGNTS